MGSLATIAKRRFSSRSLGAITLILLVFSLIFFAATFTWSGTRLLPQTWQSSPPDPTSHPLYGILPEALLSPSLDGLATRLEAWRSLPVESHAEALESNNKRCPPILADKLVNIDQLNGENDFWQAINSSEITQRRSEIIDWLALHAAEGAALIQPHGEKSRGIVLTGGNQDTTLRVITVLRHLKKVGNTLPIEVFHYPDELGDNRQRREIEELGANIVEVRDVGKVPGVWKNWQIKGAAMVQSSFTELVYLDSDNIPLRSVEDLFEAPRYLKNGRAAFWPDLSKDHPNNAIWRLVGARCELEEWTFESGQIVIDKAGNDGLNLAALWIALAMQAERDFWFHMCGGDKDTFRWAFRILDIPYTPAPRWMSALGFVDEMDADQFCGHTTLQYDLSASPQPLFVHSNLLKHLGGRRQRGKVFTHVKRMALDAFDEPSLNYAHMHVNFGVRGMCLRLDMRDTGDSDLTEEQREKQRVLLTPVEEIEGQPFDGFEDAFFEEGGRVGGW